MDLLAFKKIFQVLKKDALLNRAPVDTLKNAHKNNPFNILIAAIVSTRTQDKTTAAVCKKLFSQIKSFEDIERISLKELERLIYPAGFYRMKARNLKKLAEIINKNFCGALPQNREELMKLPGVGRKVANLVLSAAFKKAAICVDVHVHRISNRLGLVATKNPYETEKALTCFLPKSYWREINYVFVSFGQRICKPISPLCEKCPIEKWCPKINV